ncbi:ATP-binding protein [Candidatus Methanoprimaticola sp. MG2]|uniref:ATP-binding protein n=1 Tax=Candidatus Methanoprimaticola sp. MG2 TaxID=3228838 RepID=UPI0039C5F369
MHVSLSGVGALPDVSLELEGLTVLAGINGVGKSTVLKSIYTMVESLTDIDRKKDKEIGTTISKIQRRLNFPRYDRNSHQTALVNYGDYGEMLDSLEVMLAENANARPEVSQLLTKARQLLDGELDEEFIEVLVKRNIMNHFGSSEEFRRLGSEAPGVIRIYNGSEHSISVLSDDTVHHTGDLSEISRIIYYDTPLVLDHSILWPSGHRDDLSMMLRGRDDRGIIETMVDDEVSDRFMQLVNGIVPGDVTWASRGFKYRLPDGHDIGMENMASGMKVFSILKTLFRNGGLGPGVILLMDEPETHVHPMWQNTLAEIIVIMSKYMGVNILLASHSPQLIMAIDIYSKEYGSPSRYYRLSRDSRGDVVMDDLSNDPASIISDMAAPYRTLEDIRWGD